MSEKVTYFASLMEMPRSATALSVRVWCLLLHENEDSFSRDQGTYTS